MLNLNWFKNNIALHTKKNKWKKYINQSLILPEVAI